MKPDKMLLALLAVAASASACTRTQNAPPTVSKTPEEVHAKFEAGERVVLLDVRTPEEYYGELGHVQGAILIPLPELATRMIELQEFKADTIVVYCKTTHWSARAVSKLRENGFAAVQMAGGIVAWRADNLPVVLEEKE
jgi:rhodanese-related sulfurtransferase